MSTPAPPRLPVRTRLPRVWPGYVVALAFFGVAAGELMIDPSSPERPSPLRYITWLIGYIYWFVCVHAFHRVMGEATGGVHPISPRRAVGFHFIPFFNLYWVFRWTNALVGFVNPRLPASADMARGWAGVVILVALLLAQWDSGLALLVLFGLASYLRSKIRQATEAAPGWPRWDDCARAPGWAQHAPASPARIRARGDPERPCLGFPRTRGRPRGRPLEGTTPGVECRGRARAGRDPGRRAGPAL